MVNSRYEYVKKFEEEEKLLKDTFICVNVKTLDFDQFCIDHKFLNPFDDRIIRLNAECARHVMEDFTDIDISYGFMGEFSFIFKRTTATFNRRRDKILTNLTSLFASTFAYRWSKYFSFPIQYPPSFISTITLFPRLRIVKDYLLWRQELSAVECLNLYTINVLERSGKSHEESLEIVKNTNESEKNEILFKNGINFNSLPDWHKRGKILFREKKIYESSDNFATKKANFWEKHKKLLRPANSTK